MSSPRRQQASRSSYVETLPVPVNGSERARMLETQRARLLAAAGQATFEQGISSVTVAHIVERAGVSRRTFYEIFGDAGDCLRALLGDALERAQSRVAPAWRSQGSWRERLRRSLTELLCLFDEEPVLAQLLIVESLSAGRDVLQERARVLNMLASALDEGRAEARPGPAPTLLAAEGALGGVLGVLHARLSQRVPGGLVELTGELMSILVLPHLGIAAARRELERPLAEPARHPQSETPPAPLRSDPFKDAGMRLTYRTMRVLSVIAEHPGCSNRQVGDLAEMSDQGQISKLLSRLERSGMVANGREEQGRGEANVWTLTAVGQQVIQAIRPHAELTAAQEAGLA